MYFVKNLVQNNFHALTNQNFRYYWVGQCISLIGTWMQSIGQAWLVYTLTGSPLLLGLLGAMQFLPVTLLSLFAGVLIDQYSKKKILIVTQSVSMLLALTLAALVFTHTVRYEYILVLAVLLGITNAVDLPARQTFIFEIVGKDDLLNALALSSVIQNLAKILGPSVGAMLMATVGAGWCFLINGFSFTTLIIGLIMIKVAPVIREKSTYSVIGEIRDGLRYIFKTRILLYTLFLVLVIGIFAYNYNVLMPVLVNNILFRDAKTFGLLMVFLGVGSLIGALTVSGRNRSTPSIRVMVLSSLLIGAFYALIGFFPRYGVSAVAFAFIGLFSIYFATTTNAILQVNSSDRYRGRVISVYAMFFAGATPIGSILSGVAVENMGVVETFKFIGIMIFSLIIALFLLFAFIRKYREPNPGNPVGGNG